MESATAMIPRTSRRQALARRRPRRRCVAADLPGRGTRTPLRQPRASLESKRGGSRRTREPDCPPAAESRPRTGQSRPSVRIQTQDLTNAPQESIMLPSAQKPIHWADHGTCPIPAEPTQFSLLLPAIPRARNHSQSQSLRPRTNSSHLNPGCSSMKVSALW